MERASTELKKLMRELAAALDPLTMAMAGRALIRRGELVLVIQVDPERGLRLLPAASHDVAGGPDPASWRYRCAVGGPARTLTFADLPAASVIHLTYSVDPERPWRGYGPLYSAQLAGRLSANTSAMLADEAGGPLAQLLAVPQDGGDDGTDDPLAELKADIRTARGKALLVETAAAGWGEGRTAAPQRDWMPARLGPHPPATLAAIRKDTFEAVLAACGTPPSLFTDADGTSQREAVRRWHLNTVLPLARILETELSEKLEAEVGLKFDNYPLDLAGRAQSFQKLVAGGVAVNAALVTAGLLSND